MTAKDQFVFILVWGGWLLFIVLTLVSAALAWTGVRVGERRAASAEAGA